MSKSDLKDKILNEIATGATPQQCAEKYNVSAGTIRSWLHRSKCNVAKKKSATQRKTATKKTGKNKNDQLAECEKPHEPSVCGAMTKQGHICRNPSGFKTDHLGSGRCRYHGGCSTGPKNGTGEYSAIWIDSLTDEEKEIYYSIDTDNIVQVDQEIRLLDIRIRRMLTRINGLKDELYTMISYDEEKIFIDSPSGDGDEIPATVKRRKYENTIDQIQRIEEALTRVQDKKAKLIDIKYRFEADMEGHKKRIDNEKIRLEQERLELERKKNW